jgi:hypothetical protein
VGHDVTRRRPHPGARRTHATQLTSKAPGCGRQRLPGCGAGSAEASEPWLRDEPTQRAISRLDRDGSGRFVRLARGQLTRLATSEGGEPVVH